MHYKLIAICTFAPAALLLASCEVIEESRHHRHYHHHSSYGSGYTSSIHANRYDAYGSAIFGYDGDRPVYGYSQIGRPIYALNQLYADCYVPCWGSLSDYPAGVRRVPSPPSF